MTRRTGISSVVSSSNVNGLAGMLSAVLAQTANIQAADSAIDSKANNLMAAALVIVALIGTQLYDSLGKLRTFVIASMAILFVVVVLVLWATRNRKYRGAVVDLKIHAEYFAKDDELLLAQLVKDANRANRHNDVILEDKRRLFRLAIIVFMIGFALGITALFIKDSWGSI